MVKKVAPERRQTVRAKRILSIQYRLVKVRTKSTDVNWYLSTTNDISASGLTFLSSVPYRVKDILELRVVMSGILDIFKGMGQVMRIERKESGIFYMIAIKIIERKPSKRKMSSRTLRARTGIRATRPKKSPKRK